MAIYDVLGLGCIYAHISNKEHLYSKKSIRARKIGIAYIPIIKREGVLMKPSPTPPFNPL